jgi:tetratricopeptide (TPR) repeat protein
MSLRLIALGLAVMTGAAFADPARDCQQEEDYELSIRGCSYFIEMAGRGNIVMSLNRRGLAYYRKGEFERALADLDQAIRLSPNYRNAYNSRAWVLLKARRLEEARIDVNKAIAFVPNADNLDTRGHILLALGDIEGALNDFNYALQGRPESISALSGRGQAFEAKGLIAEALLDFQRAAGLKAGDFDDREAQKQAQARLVALEATTSLPDPKFNR